MEYGNLEMEKSLNRKNRSIQTKTFLSRPKDSIEEKAVGGEARFRLLIPNATYCDDGELVRVGFLTPAEVGEFILDLEDRASLFMI